MIPNNAQTPKLTRIRALGLDIPGLPLAIYNAPERVALLPAHQHGAIIELFQEEEIVQAGANIHGYLECDHLLGGLELGLQAQVHETGRVGRHSYALHTTLLLLVEELGFLARRVQFVQVDLVELLLHHLAQVDHVGAANVDALITHLRHVVGL